MHRFGLIVAWLVVAALATGLAWGVLSSADRGVGEAASTPVLGVDGTAPTTVTTASSTTTTSTDAPPTSSSTTTTRSTGTSTPATAPTTSTTSTTTPTAPTSTTSASVSWAQSTVPSPGGVVVVGHRPHEVRLESATPAPGFTMEIDKQGPDEVRVEFENDDESYEVRVRWENGALTTEVD